MTVAKLDVVRVEAGLERWAHTQMLIAGISLATSIAPPMTLYVLKEVPAVTEVHVVKQISSPAMAGASLALIFL